MDRLFYDIFHPRPRQGPGSQEATLRALSLLGLHEQRVRALDIGCCTGAQTLDLARSLRGTITAVDNYQPLLDTIAERAKNEALKAEIVCQCRDMNDLWFEPESFDLIWAEGSIYIIGFRKGLEKIHTLLKPGGAAVFSDLNWLKADPPEEVLELFRTECMEMMTVQENVDLIERSAFRLIGHFPLDEKGHWMSYYQPLEERLEAFRKEYSCDKNVIDLINSIQHEIDVYRKFSAYFGYTFYIMKNT